MEYILPELSIIIPTKDDHLRVQDNLDEITSFLNKKIEKYEVLIVSNNSSYESVKYLDELASKNVLVKHFSIQIQGKGAAIKNGIENSIYRYLLFIDADCSVKINEFDNFVKDRSLKSPFVIGNRKNKLSKNLNSPFIRKLSGYVYLKLVQFLFGITIEDTQCGFKAIDKVKFLSCNTFTTTGFAFDIELIYLALNSGLRVEEIPVQYVHDSDSKVNVLIESVSMFIQILKIRFRLKRNN